MTEDPRDPAADLAEGMEAAGALIESLEQEVESLRSDLEGASAALKAAQEEVSSRADVLQEGERARLETEREAEELRAQISTLKQQHSDEQLRLSNEHINELARVRRDAGRTAQGGRGRGLLRHPPRHHQGGVPARTRRYGSAATGRRSKR